MRIWRETTEANKNTEANIPSLSVLNSSDPGSKLPALEEGNDEDEEDMDFDVDKSLENGSIVSCLSNNSNVLDKAQAAGTESRGLQPSDSDNLGPTLLPGSVGGSVGSHGVSISREPSEGLEIHHNFRIPINAIPVSAERAEFEDMWTSIMEEETLRRKIKSRAASSAARTRPRTPKDTDLLPQFDGFGDRETEEFEGGIALARNDFGPDVLDESLEKNAKFPKHILNRNWFHQMSDPDATPSALINDEWMMRESSDNLMNKNVVQRSLELYPPIIGKPKRVNDTSADSVTQELAVLKLSAAINNGNSAKFISSQAMSEELHSNSLLTRSPTNSKNARSLRRHQNAQIDPLAPKKKDYSQLVRQQEVKAAVARANATTSRHSSSAPFLPAINMNKLSTAMSGRPTS
jgi:hypothetical protein